MIELLPVSPNKQITHEQVREKVNEVATDINGLITNKDTATDGQVLTANGDKTSTFKTIQSGGDMTKNVFDPQNINGDAFARSKHTGQQLAETISDFEDTVNGLDSVTEKAPKANPTFTGEVNGITKIANQNGGNDIKFWGGTQAQYDALTPNLDTYYFID